MSPERRLLFFPTPLPDESLYSVVAQYHRMRGYRASKTTLHELFGRHSLLPVTGLPTGLETLEKVLPDAWLEQPWDLVSLTAWPYYRPFLSERVARLIEEDMRGNDGRGVKTRMGLPASRLGAADMLRFCSRCAAEDSKEFGVAYWHRCHQLPCVWACHRHGDLLVGVRPPSHRPGRHQLSLPQGDETGEWETLRIRTDAHGISALARHAVLAAEVLEKNHGPIAPIELRRVYRHGLEQKGLLTGGGAVRQRQLHDEVSHHHRDLLGISCFRLLAPHAEGQMPWLSKLTRKQRTTSHPVKHLLLIDFLYGGFELFLDQLTGPHVESVPQALPGVAEIGPTLGERLKPLIGDEGFSLRQAAQRLGVSTTTLSVLAERENLSIGRSRPKRMPAKVCRAVLRDLRRALPLEKIQARHGVSRSHLGRLLRIHPKIRERRRSSEFRRRRSESRTAIAAAQLDLDDPTSSRLREAAPGAWMWLYRHDREWLQAQMPYGRKDPPPASRADWARRDLESVRKLKDAARQLAAIKPPVRLHATTLARQAGILSFTEKHSDQLPRTAQYLRLNAESLDSFRIRRILWAASTLKAEGTPVVPWLIQRLAGLPPAIPLPVRRALREACGQMVLSLDTDPVSKWKAGDD